MKNKKTISKNMFKSFLGCLTVSLTSFSLAESPHPTSSAIIEGIQIKSNHVKGYVYRTTPYHNVLGSHVHVQVINARGKKVAQETDVLPTIMPKDSPRQARSLFEVEFQQEIPASAQVRVVYVSHPHADCL